MTHTRKKLASLLLLATLGLGVAACGDDGGDDVAASGDAEETEEEPTTTEGDDAGGDGAEGEEGDGPPEVNPCAEGVTPDEAGLPPAEEPAEGATPVTITATEYAFAGAEALEAGGSFAITFENKGVELHEIAIVKLAEGEERPLEELMASEEEPETTDIAFGFACPGQSTVVNAEITEPGRYVALCFVPVGTTPETDFSTMSEDGTPHAANGMVHEFRID